MSTDLVVPGAEGAGDGASLRITAENVPQFLTLIRAMVEHSGRTRGQIVTVSGLPRSTVYHFTSEKNTSLPKSRDQVRALARACKLDDTQVGEVLKIWDRLAREEYETGRTPEQEPKPLTFTVSNSESITVEDGKFVLEQRVVRSDSQWKRRLNVLTSGAMLVLVVMLIGVLATGLKARDQAETARFEAEQRAAMVANALVAGGG
ncbi:hypothetical protein, partial [Nocardia asteroides]|uniref:hypothetical protein n=1 Tax=Nocardia asteroides TaxID=1824 RepID=UPI0033ED319A